MAEEKKKMSANLLSNLTQGKVAGVQNKLSGLQPRLADMQSKIAAQKDLIGQINPDAQYSGGHAQAVAGQKQELGQMEQNLAALQREKQGYESQIADPSSLLSGREKDIIGGAQFGEALLGDEGLGRLGTDPTMSGIGERFAELSKGYSSEEMLARKEKGLETIGAQNMAQQRALQAQLARAGVKGSAAGAQVRDVAVAGLQQKANLERDLLIQGREAERAGLQDYAEFSGEVKKFDLGQAAKEKDIILQSGMGYAQLGSAERTAKAQSEAAERAAASKAAAACFPENTLIELEDGQVAHIQTIAVGTKLKNGAIVQIIGEGRSDDFYLWNEIILTGKHCVKEKMGWCEVENASKAVKLDLPEQTVYNMYVTGNEISLYGSTVADFASLWTLGGLHAYIYNEYKKVRKFGLRNFKRMVASLGLGSSRKKALAPVRINTRERR